MTDITANIHILISNCRPSIIHRSLPSSKPNIASILLFPAHPLNNLTESLELHLQGQFGVGEPGSPLLQADQIADRIFDLLVLIDQLQCVLAQVFVEDLGVDKVPYLQSLRDGWPEEFDEVGAAEVVPEFQLDPPLHQLKRLLRMRFFPFVTVEQDLCFGEVEAVADDQLGAVSVALVLGDAAVPDCAPLYGLVAPFLVALG